MAELSARSGCVVGRPLIGNASETRVASEIVNLVGATGWLPHNSFTNNFLQDAKEVTVRLGSTQAQLHDS